MRLWEVLARRFGHLDEPERAMRRFDARKQLDGESVAEYEQALRTLYSEAWPKADENTRHRHAVLLKPRKRRAQRRP